MRGTVPIARLKKTSRAAALLPRRTWMKRNFCVSSETAAALRRLVLPRLGPVGQRLPNAKAISYSIFLSHGKSLLSPIVDLPKL